MSVSVEVYRGAGARAGADIVEPLLGQSISAALARGRAELDARAHPKVSTDIEVGYRADLRCGDLLAVLDADQGSEWRGQIVAVSHRHKIDPPVSITKITVERIAHA